MDCQVRLSPAVRGHRAGALGASLLQPCLPACQNRSAPSPSRVLLTARWGSPLALPQAKAGLGEEALGTYRRMRAAGLPPTPYTFSILIVGEWGGGTRTCACAAAVLVIDLSIWPRPRNRPPPTSHSLCRLWARTADGSSCMGAPRPHAAGEGGGRARARKTPAPPAAALRSRAQVAAPPSASCAAAHASSPPRCRPSRPAPWCQAGVVPDVAVWNSLLAAHARSGSVDASYATWTRMLDAGERRREHAGGRAGGAARPVTAAWHPPSLLPNHTPTSPLPSTPRHKCQASCQTSSQSGCW